MTNNKKGLFFYRVVIYTNAEIQKKFEIKSE